MTFDPKEYGRQYRLDNKEKIAAKKKEWIEKNKDRLKEKARQYRVDNKERISAASKEWRLNNPDKVAQIEFKRRLKRQYNITVDDYNNLFRKQEGRCGICFKLPGDTRLSIDHCHDTGTIRGLLCNSCNRGIGLLQDSPIVLRSAVQYLEERTKVQ